MLICSGLLDYCPKTGKLTWQVRQEALFKSASHCVGWNKRHAGNVAGSKKQNENSKNYLTVRMCGKTVVAHRLIMSELGLLPDGHEVDHRNGDGTDNRLPNLKAVLRSENNMNIRMQSRNKTGVTGVRLHRSGSTYGAFIITGRKRHWLGSYKTIFDAAAARKSAEITFGFGPSHGKPMTDRKAAIHGSEC